MMEIQEEVQKLLFEYPLYHWCRRGDSVLVRGDDEFAERFADQFFQVSQGMELSLFWLISDRMTREKYLKKRPGMKKFISVDGSAPWGENYGSLTFLEKPNWNRAVQCSYGFISGHGEFQKDRFRAWVEDGKILTDHAPLRNVCTEDLDRMALNTHLVWEGRGNINIESVRERFAKSEYANSSRAFAVSLPYKLFSVGIENREASSAAEAMHTILVSRAPEDLHRKALLTVLEHRRWIMEKISQGAVSFDHEKEQANYQICVDTGKIKQKVGGSLMHPCLEPCSMDSTLENYSDREQWNREGPTDPSLDPLDTMSLQLHRTMFQAAQKLRQDPHRVFDALYELKRFYDTPKLKRNMDRYRFCIQNILDYSRPYADQFDAYDRAMRAGFAKMKSWQSSEAEDLLNEIRRLLFPALHLYQDYKQNDRDLIQQIPYILTAKYPVHLCVPLGSTSKRDNNDAFRSVASATALYANCITYLYAPEPSEQAEHLRSRLKAIRNYFNYRDSRCQVYLRVLVDAGWGEKRNRLEKVLKLAKKQGDISDFSFHTYRDDQELICSAVEQIRSSGADYYDGTNRLIGSPSVSAKMLQQIPIPYLEFDSYHQKFCHCQGCEHLQYVPITSFLQIEDMFSLMNAEDVLFTYQDFADSYREYWDIFSGNAIGEDQFPVCTAAWTRLSNLLQRGGECKTSYMREEIPADSDNELRVIRKMLSRLQKIGAIRGLQFEEDSRGVLRFVSIDYVDDTTKRLMTKAGDILEIYVYFEACRENWFDDVQTGYRFCWEADSVKNELDCILTHGYRSILVECKSVKEGKTDFYLTLDSLGDHFGINYKKVLIMVTEMGTEQYQTCVSRGEQLDIITLSSRDDLNHIGERLREIMEY